MPLKLENILVLIFFILFALSALFGLIWAFSTEKRLKRFFVGKKAKDLEDTIIYLEENIRDLKKETVSLQKELDIVSVKLRKSLRGLSTLRFNPFPDQGSNQSFAIGILNEEGDGVVLSSLYSRERMSVFAKPIKNSKSEYELSEEEREVLKKAEVK
jgi:hypothetical protein